MKARSALCLGLVFTGIVLGMVGGALTGAADLPVFLASEGMTGESEVWRYERVLTGTDDYFVMDSLGNNRWWGGVVGDWRLGSIGETPLRLHPGANGVDAVVTFVAPWTGQIRIGAAGEIRTYESEGDGVRLRIMRNDEIIWPAEGWHQVDPGVRWVFPEFELDIEAGDRLRFVVNAGSAGNNNWDETYWEPRITYDYVAVQSVVLSEERLELAVGETAVLAATVYPPEATNKTVRWTSSSPRSVRVIGGRVEVRSPGDAVITVTTIDGGHEAKAEVVVTTTLEEHFSSMISPDNPGMVAQLIELAAGQGVTKITIPPGVYRLPPGSGQYHMVMSNVSDIEIDATGSTFIATEPRQGILQCNNCSNVTWRGGTFDYETMPFTQGVIERIDPEHRWFDIRIDAGYPARLDDVRYHRPDPPGYIFDPETLLMKPGTIDMYSQRVERLGDDLFRVYWQPHVSAASRNQPVEVGDLMAFRGVFAFGIYLPGSSNVTLTDVTIHASPGFAIIESNGEGNNRYHNITVTPGPKPPGAVRDRLFSSVADGFHSSRMRHGPIIEHSTFEKMGDDGIAINGPYAMVIEADQTTVIIATQHENFFRPGDLLRAYDGRMAPIGEAGVVAVEENFGYQPSETVRARQGSGPAQRDGFSGNRYHRLTLSRPLQLSYADFVASPQATGSGYILRNNTIRNHRARGALLKADNGLIEGNTFSGSSMYGVLITPETSWNEADYSHNVVIRGNTFTDFGRYGMQAAGALAVKGYPGAIGHENIVIEDNVFADNVGVNLIISSAKNVEVRNNRFERTHGVISPTQSNRAVDHGAVVMLEDVENVRFTGNSVSERGPFWRHDVVLRKGASSETFELDQTEFVVEGE